jgi:hypothetical protein
LAIVSFFFGEQGTDLLGRNVFRLRAPCGDPCAGGSFRKFCSCTFERTTMTADRPDPRSFLPFGKMGSAIPTTAKRAKRFIEALNRIRWDANKSKNPGVSMDLRNTGPKSAERSIVEARGISELVRDNRKGK